MSAPGTLPSRQNSLRRAGTGSDVTAFEVGGQPVGRHYRVSRVFTPLVPSDISGDSTIVMSNTPGEHHDNIPKRLDVPGLSLRMAIAVASLKHSTFSMQHGTST